MSSLNLETLIKLQNKEQLNAKNTLNYKTNSYCYIHTDSQDFQQKQLIRSSPENSNAKETRICNAF